MEKRTLIAFLLVSVIWVVYFVFNKPKPPIDKGTTKISEKTKSDEADISVKEKKDTGSMPVAITLPQRNAPETTINIDTKKYTFELTSRGAAIKSVRYIERKIELSVQKNPYNARGIFDFSLHFNDDEFLRGNALDDAIWSFKKTNNATILFHTAITVNGNPVTVEKIYTFPDDGYNFSLEYRIRNSGRKDISFTNDMIIVSPSDMVGPSLDFENTYNKLSSIYYINGDYEQSSKGGGSIFTACTSSSEKEPLKKESGNTAWAGIMSRYFLVIMIPQEFSGKGIIHDNRKESGFRTGIYIPINAMKPGEEIKRSFKVYIGEKNKEKLAAVDKSIIDAADVNKLIEPIRYFVIWCLLTINKLFGNVGWSLVIFSLLTKIVFMPLTIKSTESMKKMQKLTPKLNEIKAKYKDKPDVMQKEMMKLYKENKVNPMGGCFPLLLQMPFFFALYSALINSIDLWHAPFILWIKDLSMPDTVLTISGFNLNILPIIMTATTFLQQKLTTVDTGGQQQKIMMMMMPVVFIFIFWNMPSGLVLYWALQNIFQVLHQVFVNYRAKAKEG